MHSLVVLGDTRRHSVKTEPGDHWNADDCGLRPPFSEHAFLGGTYFLLEAVRAFLTSTQVYSYKDGPIEIADASSFSDFRFWTLVPVRLSQHDHDVTRLNLNNAIENILGFPALDDSLVSVLLQNTTFEPLCHSLEHPLNIVREANSIIDAIVEPPAVHHNASEVFASEPFFDAIKAIKEKIKEEASKFRIMADELEKEILLLEDVDGTNIPEARKTIQDVSRRCSPIYWQVPTCPDLIAIDDLNLGFRSLKLPISVTQDGNGLTFEPNAIADCMTDLKSISNGNIDRVKSLKAALTLLIERCQQSREQAKLWNELPVMEPLIIGSIADSPHTVFSTVDIYPPQNDTFWGIIYKYEWLRERTIVVLNVDDLRNFGLPISSGLSWERTAQDTISELRRSKEYRRFFDFGHLVIRYGVTGALHVVRRGVSEWTYTLFFTPELDDQVWSTGESEQVVLGVPALMTAAIIKAISLRCEEAGGHPLLDKLPGAVHEGIIEGLARGRNLALDSYGNGCWRSFDIQMEKGNLYPTKILTEDFEKKGHSKRNEASPISVSSVPPLVLREWSILSQSVQTRIGEIAREIVLYGPSDVLNQPILGSSREFLFTLRDNILKKLETHLVTLNNKKRLDWKSVNWERDLTSLFHTSLHGVYSNQKIFGNRSLIAQQSILSAHGLRKNQPDPLTEVICKLVTDCLESNNGPDGLANKLKNNPAIFDLDRQFVKFARNLGIVDTGPLGAPVCPIIRFKDKEKRGRPLHVVDRREIEGTRSLEKLMRSHIEDVQSRRNLRPLSIAVFGPPGSGKSTAVRSINASLAFGATQILEPVNLSQLSGINDLDREFETISQKSNAQNVPIVFMDEFDCKSPEGNTPLGWLKYFLAPMEDGIFRGKNVKNAILVFAGGTKTTFNEFSLAGRSRDDNQWVGFSEAKGPDFVSRLRGHLNIVGVNPADPDDELYLIRRALLIRNIISAIQNLSEGQRADIDDNMLRAILHVPVYWHGARAVRMFLELCSSGIRRKISASSVPPINQLNMLVDGKAFLDLLNNIATSKQSLTP